MNILVFLQNQWFRDPDRVREMYEEHPEHRQRYIASFLFMGCRTGRVLEECWGEKLCQEVTWEESSPVISGNPSACPPADLGHMMDAIIKFNPDIVVTLGSIATNGLIACTSLWGQQSYMDCELKIRYCVALNSSSPPSKNILRIDNYESEDRQFILLTGPHPTARRGDPTTRLREIGYRLLVLKQQAEESLPLEDEALSLED